MTSLLHRRCLGLLITSLGLGALACGGSGANSDRKAAPKVRPHFNDSGSMLTYSCAADQRSSGIVTQLIDDWELLGGTGMSASSGWYTNNDRCEVCQSAQDEIRFAEPTPGVIVSQDLLDAGISALRACTEDCLAAQVPNYFEKPIPAEAVPPTVDEVGHKVYNRCGSKYAFHVVSGPFTKWGGQLGGGYNPPLCVTGSECPTDGTSLRLAPAVDDPMPDAPYEGIAFWARVAPGSGTNLQVQIGESHTDYKYPLTLDNPPCVDQVGIESPNDTTKGCDKFATFVTLNSDWQFFVLPFSEMRQGGWGKKAPFFDIQHISNLTFYYGQGVWDIWIDDIFFYKRSAQ